MRLENDFWLPRPTQQSSAHDFPYAIELSRLFLLTKNYLFFNGDEHPQKFVFQAFSSL